MAKEVSGYLEKLSSIESSPEGVSTSVLNLKNLKK